MSLHMIKLVVGIDNLDDFYEWQRAHIFDYDGVPANIVRTRFKPKAADEILQSGGSIYRVMKRRILCRQKIIGFEQAESADRGTQCLIMCDTEIIQTYSKPKRPFQGWRYLKPEDAPKDRGIYQGGGQLEDIPPDLEKELMESGLL
ncbi:MAG: DUF1489 domain-containing protein [Pseudomonadota bacterium]